MSFFESSNLKHYHTDIDVPKSRRRKSIPSTSSSSGPIISSSSHRRKVSSVNEIEFTESGTSRRRKKKIADVGYEKNHYSFDRKKHLRRSPWYLFAFFLVRLFFMDRGVIEYFDTQDKLALMNFQLNQGKQEIKQIDKEIKLIKTSKSYQKKLARDHLGVIGPDEYLVLFAQESKAPSI